MVFINYHVHFFLLKQIFLKQFFFTCRMKSTEFMNLILVRIELFINVFTRIWRISSILMEKDLELRHFNALPSWSIQQVLREKWHSYPNFKTFVISVVLIVSLYPNVKSWFIKFTRYYQRRSSNRSHHRFQRHRNETHRSRSSLKLLKLTAQISFKVLIE